MREREGLLRRVEEGRGGPHRPGNLTRQAADSSPMVLAIVSTSASSSPHFLPDFPAVLLSILRPGGPQAPCFFARSRCIVAAGR